MKNVFPREIANAVDGVDDELRQGILSFLILNEKATYSKIKNTFGATNGNLNHHLNLLIEDGLLAKTLEKEDDKINSYYRISAFGKQFVNCLFDSLKPRPTNLPKELTLQNEKQPLEIQVLGNLLPSENVSRPSTLDWKIFLTWQPIESQKKLQSQQIPATQESMTV